MFDTIGKTNDEEAGKRRAASVVIATGIVGFVVGTIMLYGTMVVVEKVVQVVQEEDIVEIVIEDPVLDEALPPPPPPPPLGPASSSTDEPDPEPQEMSEQVKELDQDIKDEVKADVPSGGSPEGSPLGQEGGVAGGVPGGVPGGQVGGQLGGGYTTMHHTDVQWKTKIVPDYPESAREMNLGDVNCKVRLFIDEKGMPADIAFEACPKVFHEAVKEAFFKSRWYPAKVGGAKTKAQFLLVYNFKVTG